MKNREKEIFICYETFQVKTFHEWRVYYEESVDKMEYPDFDTWWLDMRKTGVLEKADEIVFISEEKCEKYIVFKHGTDDFSIFYDKSNYSFRGNKNDVKMDYHSHFAHRMNALTKEECLQMIVTGLITFCKGWNHNWMYELKNDCTPKTFFKLFTKHTRTYFFEWGANHYDVEFLKDEKVLVKRCGPDYAKIDTDMELTISEVLELINQMEVV